MLRTYITRARDDANRQQRSEKRELCDSTLTNMTLVAMSHGKSRNRLLSTDHHVLTQKFVTLSDPFFKL